MRETAIILYQTILRRWRGCLALLLLLPLFPAAAAQTASGYTNYASLKTQLDALAAAHPDHVKIFSLGQSYGGRELWAAKISDNVAQDEAEPEALFLGLYHAREHLTTEMALAIVRWLADDYASDAQVKRLVDTRQIYVVPMVNPDGGEYDLADYGNRFWRKNRQPSGCSSADLGSGYGEGTDLNRNHGYRWGGAGASADPCSLLYRGSAPASAPEVAAVERFVNGRAAGGRQRLSVAVSFHSYGELVLYPYGYQSASECGTPAADMRAQDLPVFQQLAAAMARSNGYTAQQSCQLYPTNGDFTDWAYGTQRIFAFTFEMYPIDDSPGFYPPASAIDAQTARNRAAVLTLLEYAGCPYSVNNTADQYCTAGATNPPQLVWLPLVKR